MKTPKVRKIRDLKLSLAARRLVDVSNGLEEIHDEFTRRPIKRSYEDLELFERKTKKVMRDLDFACELIYKGITFPPKKKQSKA